MENHELRPSFVPSVLPGVDNPNIEPAPSVSPPKRVAFFPDSYLEVNGAAMTCKRLVGYAAKNEHPFLCIHAGKTTAVTQEGSVRFLSLKRSPLAFRMDEELSFDPLFQRHSKRVLRELVEFEPDVIHITGLNDVSIIGALLGWKTQIPILGSWHTNLHEFAARRIEKMLRFLPGSLVHNISSFAEKKILDGSIQYYRMPKVVLSPNMDLVELLAKGTKRKSLLMSRGVDCEKFSPAHRTVNDGIFRFGFVGRLRAEKNVRRLVDLERALLKAGVPEFRFLVVGEGDEHQWLKKHLTKGEFTGFLEGDELSQAYANMDLFIFPSDTDAFGNVVQEATASGVPAIVTDRGGPKFIIRHGESGYVANNFDEFISYSIELVRDDERLKQMKAAARESALAKSWDSVFEAVYRAYDDCYALRNKEQRLHKFKDK
ncbi:MAG TPA: glycosyltransferase [Pyrinomonadaceae bacterium]|nr:glycosyltransferase [Pyrinomonadaceae bacterium]